MESSYHTITTDALKSAVNSSPCIDATEMVPVKCFYRNAVSSMKAVADNNPSEICSGSTTTGEKLSSVTTNQLQLKQAKTQQHFGKKHHMLNNGLRESGLTSANRKPKTVERRKVISGTQMKRAGGMKPSRAASYSTLIFKTLDNDDKLRSTEYDDETAGSACAPIEKENRCKDSRNKRFFKNRATGGRKHITSVAGRSVDVGSLSKLLNKKVSTNSVSSDVANSGHSHLMSESACSSTIRNAIGDVSQFDTVVIGAEINTKQLTCSEQKFSPHSARNQQNIEPLQISDCLASGKNFSLHVVDNIESNDLPSKTDLTEDSGMPSTSPSNKQIMLSPPMSSSAAVSTPRRMMLRSPGSRSSICSPATPISRRSPGKCIVCLPL